MKRRGKDIGKLKIVIELLMSDHELPKSLRDHDLTGQWKGTRDLHIETDWILLYEISDEELVLVRTGSHSDLF